MTNVTLPCPANFLWTDLTTAEQTALSLKYDSAILQQAIADTIRNRRTSPLTAEELRVEIKRQMDLSAWYETCLKADAGNEWMAFHDRREMLACLDRVTALESQLEALERVPTLMAAE